MKLGTPPFASPVNQGGIMSASWSQFIADIQRLVSGLVDSGTTAQRPTKNLYEGRMYFDMTLGLPIWYDGSAWIKADGTAA